MKKKASGFIPEKAHSELLLEQSMKRLEYLCSMNKTLQDSLADLGRLPQSPLRDGIIRSIRGVLNLELEELLFIEWWIQHSNHTYLLLFMMGVKDPILLDKALAIQSAVLEGLKSLDSMPEENGRWSSDALFNMLRSLNKTKKASLS